MTVKLPTKQHLEFLSLKGGFTGSSKSTLVKMPHCWKSHVAAHITFRITLEVSCIISYIENLCFSLPSESDFYLCRYGSIYMCTLISVVKCINYLKYLNILTKLAMI